MVDDDENGHGNHDIGDGDENCHGNDDIDDGDENCHGNHDTDDGDDLHLAIEQSFDKSVGSVERR